MISVYISKQQVTYYDMLLTPTPSVVNSPFELEFLMEGNIDEIQDSSQIFIIFPK